MADVTSPKERIEQLVSRDTRLPYQPPALGSEKIPSRCPRCSFPLQDASRKDAAGTGWTMAPFLRDSLATLGAGAAGAVSGVYSFNWVMPRIGRRFPSSLALQYALGVPPVALLTSVGAGLGAGVLPAFVQLCMTSYYTASSTSNAAISAHRQGVKESDPKM